jgi:hypothetical protein
MKPRKQKSVYERVKQGLEESIAYARGELELRTVERLDGAQTDRPMAATTFEVGRSYSRQEISAAVGGSIRSYLPLVKGRVVCGCFRPDPKFNPGAPEKITIRRAHRREPRLVRDLAEPIPVFLRRSPGAWEYRGRYRCTGFCTEPELLRDEMKANPARGEIGGVLYFERVGD